MFQVLGKKWIGLKIRVNMKDYVETNHGKAYFKKSTLTKRNNWYILSRVKEASMTQKIIVACNIGICSGVWATLAYIVFIG